MSATREMYHRLLDLSPRPEWSQFWHAWKILIPRRDIAGHLVWGRVLRRHDGRRWIYQTADQHYSKLSK